VALLRERYVVAYDEGVFATEGYLAGSDDRRVAELNQAFRDPHVKAVLCGRGGYGLLRILPRLDHDGLARNPKPIVGFSDCTALLAWGLTQGNTRGIHGPVVAQLGELVEEDLKALFRLLEEPTPKAQWFSGLTTWVGWTAAGPLVGGTMEILSRLIGTRYLPSLRGAILLLEEVGERPYRVDRILTHMLLAGILDGVAGIVVGNLERCEDPSGAGPTALDVVRERLTPLGVPLCAGAPVGHGTRNKAFPFGAPALLDAEAGTLTLLEGAVV